jgi:muconolactone delta-isomerase
MNMLYMVDISIEAGHMELDDLWDLWEKEVGAARGAMESGLVKSLYKVVGQRRVVGVLEADDHDMLDRIAMAGLPMANYLVFNSITPIREYESFGQDVDNRWSALG